MNNYLPLTFHKVGRLLAIISFGLATIVPGFDALSQYEPSPKEAEIWFYVKNTGQAPLGYARVHVHNGSPIWDRTFNPDSMVVTTSFDHYDLNVTDYPLQRFEFDFSGTETDMSQFRYGRYAFTIQLSDDDANWYSLDSVMVDYSDSLYCRSGYTSMDISIRYDFKSDSLNDDEWSYGTDLVDDYEDDEWDLLVDKDFSIWETNVPDPNYVPRTKSFVPEKPGNVSVTHNANGRIVLSWLGNGESFDVDYDIYRRLGANFVNYESVSNSGHPMRGHSYSWMDPEVGGSGYTSISYFLKARNVSQSSVHVSPASDTVTTTFAYYFPKNGSQEASQISFRLFQNTPNPFNPVTMISFQIPEDGFVELAIYNLLGQKVNTLLSEIKTAGIHAASWDGCDGQGRMMGSGIYFYRLVSKNGVMSRKMILLK